VRRQSFDAGGLCFRNDGREWKGHNRVRLVVAENAKAEAIALSGADIASRAERTREDANLAFLLSSRHEMDWLELGREELRRIAALHGISARRVEPLEAVNAEVRGR
jgi:hypothetical protein